MDNVEKVIKGLECCTKHGFCCDEIRDCPYIPWHEHSHCVERMMTDALALLKAQEPRVMTLEASDADWRDGVLWFEHRDYKTIKPCQFVNCRDMVLFGRPERVMCFDVVGRSSSVYMLKNYGVKYRCWTSRPDEKTREATPWEQ